MNGKLLGLTDKLSPIFGIKYYSPIVNLAPTGFDIVAQSPYSPKKFRLNPFKKRVQPGVIFRYPYK